MGIGSLSKEEAQELLQNTTFNQKELKRIYRRFSRLDKQNKGYITVDDLMNLSELDKHPLGHRIARIFTLDSNELIDFKEFARTLSIFSDNRQRDKKVQFYFRIFDMDMDGFVSGTDMFVILTMLVGQNMSNDQIQHIVDGVISEADRDGDGKLSFEEFSSLINAG